MRGISRKDDPMNGLPWGWHLIHSLNDLSELLYRLEAVAGIHAINILCIMHSSWLIISLLFKRKRGKNPPITTSLINVRALQSRLVKLRYFYTWHLSLSIFLWGSLSAPPPVTAGCNSFSHSTGYLFYTFVWQWQQRFTTKVVLSFSWASWTLKHRNRNGIIVRKFLPRRKNVV